METAIEVPRLRLVLDMGRCSNSAVNQPFVLVSHGHLDHAGALPQHAARRALMKMSMGVYLVPAPIVDAVERLFNAAGALDGHPIPRQVVAIEPGQEFALTSERFVRPFATFHRVPSQGYTIWEKRRRLRPEFRGMPGPELGRLRVQGVGLDEPYAAPLLAFSGDTRVEVLESAPELQDVDTLILEASFLDARVSVAEARSMGHIHLDEIMSRRALLRNRELVLSHFSARYTAQEVNACLGDLREEFGARLRAFGVESRA